MPFGPNSLNYRGFFRFPRDFLPDSAHSFAYGGHGPAYYPPNNSLFAVGWAGPGGVAAGQLVAELNVPAVLDGRFATFRQTFYDFTDGKLFGPPASNEDVLSGLWVEGGVATLAISNWYDGGYIADKTHIFSNTLNLADQTDASGPYRVGDLNPGYYGGYMCKVPPAWVTRLGHGYVTGRSLGSIVSRSSMGPSLHGFSDFSGAATAYLYYPGDDPTRQPLGQNNSPVVLGNPLTSINGTCTVYGVGMVDDVTFFVGMQAPGDYHYGPPVCPIQGPCQPELLYYPAIWAYNTSDLERVKLGLISPWQCLPYAVWNLHTQTNPAPDWPAFPLPNHQMGGRILLGCSFDIASRRLFITGQDADEWPQCYVYDIAV
jgi:hypothetical protein